MKDIVRKVTPFFSLLLMVACQTNSLKNPEYIYYPPDYKEIDLYITPDTLRFNLSETSTTAITSVNYFIDKDKDYLSTYDKVTKQINLYTFPGGFLLKTIQLKQWLRGTNLDKASIYVQNFDSILVCSRERIVLFDSTSRIKKDILIPREKPLRIPDMENETPPLLKNNTLFTNISPSVIETSIPAHRRWKLLFGFDLKTDEKKLYYHLPQIYQENLYGYAFLRYSYCINDKGNFVFSFPADPNVYETDLGDYNRSYFAKSKSQTGDISPIDEETIQKGFSFREYSLRDSYGAIFFDPFNKRYMRLAKQKMNDSTFIAKQRVRTRSVLLLNNELKIIGEGNLPDSIAFNSIFFTKEGNMYAKLSGVKEPFITYVRLEYRNRISGELSRNNHK